jgi:hypothetical protein
MAACWQQAQAASQFSSQGIPIFDNTKPFTLPPPNVKQGHPQTLRQDWTRQLPLRQLTPWLLTSTAINQAAYAAA